MSHVAFATSAESADLTDDDRQLAAALREHDVTVDPAVWTDDGVDWAAFDAVLVRSCWDYHTRIGEFEDWVTRVSAETTLWNSPSAICWNSHQFYLRDLAGRGVETVSTAYVSGTDTRSLETVLDDNDWREAVVKPAVSAGADHVWRTDRARADSHQERYERLRAHEDILVQRFVPEVHDGQWSLLFADGEYTHALSKRPAAGDFRPQEHLGGTTALETPTPATREAGTAVVDAATAELGETPLYARVDGIEVDDTFTVFTLDLIAPSLGFEHQPAAAGALADAVVERLNRP
ncbi:ATP-grasp domain-containing protein [Haloarchaeobius sp. DYHT-AS-18]|uniref:ATP-grasp domain-containing protein n=1 Tax=Haloarchaeobius sp. DYHT-AS-18 TaxID=3446117 RepID=UPI003EC142F0